MAEVSCEIALMQAAKKAGRDSALDWIFEYGAGSR